MKTSFIAIGSALSLLAGCGSNSSSAPAAPEQTSAADAGTVSVDIDAECPVVVSDSTCDTTQRPIVFVHGTYDSGTAIANVALLFASNGYCPGRFIAIDYDSLPWVTGSPPTLATPVIDAAIDAVLQATGFTQVDLIGHSQGALQCYSYLEDPTHAAKVAHFVQLAGGPESAPPGPPDAGVPTLSVSSESDVVEGPIGVTGADQSVLLQSEDHEDVVGSVDTFIAIWQYLHGGGTTSFPQYTSVQCGDPTITLSGVSETFGDNAAPPAGGQLEVYELGSTLDGGGAPVQTFTLGADGGTSPSFQAKRLQAYEFRGLAADGGVIGHQYFTPFKRSDSWLRFLVPSQNVLAEIATNPVTTLNDNRETTLLVRTNKGSFRQDLGDSLTVNGFQALNPLDATRQTVTVALWIYNSTKDGKSEGGSVSSFDILPWFIRGTNIYVPSSPPAWVELNFNGTIFQVENWPSVSQGLTEVTFQ
jgi:pimeloyl-ACP methyl ester carboxylesterase